MVAGCGESRAHYDAAPPVDGRLVPEHDARPGVDCLGHDCALGVACCYQVVQADKPYRLTYCAPDAGPGCLESTFECDGPEDCKDGVCCATSLGLWTCAAPEQCVLPPACHAEIDCDESSACCPTPSKVIRVCVPGGCPP